jgi:GAF domain-containing protein
MLVDEDTNELFFGAYAGGETRKIPFGFRQGLGEGMIGWAASSGEIVLANDVSQESRYLPSFLTETASELDVPLKYRGKVIGVLDLQSRQLEAFDEHDVMAMEALAGHAAAAIENAGLFEVANQRVAELRAIRQASLELTSRLELEPVLEAILESTLSMISGDDAHVFLYDGEELEFGAALWNDEHKMEPFSKPRPDGLTYTVARRGERIVVSDVNSHPLFEDTPWNGAIVGLPLTIGGEVQGVMNVAFHAPHQFTDDELWILELLADQAAIAIRNARLYDEARDRALEQETLREAALALTTALDRDEVVARVLAQLQRVVPYDTASVQLLRDGQLEIVGGRGFPNLDRLLGIRFDPTSEENPNREVVQSRSPVVVEDASRLYEEFRRDPHAPAEIRSWLGVPMLVGDRLVGMIALDKREAGFYTRKHARLAEAFAAQAAVAVENAQLHHETVQQLARTEVLRETMSAAASTLDFEQVLNRTIDILDRAMDCEYLGFMLPDENGAFMRSYPNMLGFEPPEGEYRFPIDQCLTGLVYQTGEPVILPDVREVTQYACADEAVCSELAVPVKIGDEVVAVLNLESSQLDAFDEEDLAFYTAVAGQLGMGMENAQLFEAERKQRQLSEALEEAAAAVSSTLDLEQVLDRILEQVERVVSGDTFNIMLIQGGQARIVRWRGYEKTGVADEASAYTLPVSEYPTLRKMSETGRSIVIPDTSAEDDWIPHEGWEWLQSYVAAPIQLGGTIVGFLNVDSTQPGQFNSDDARRLETFASHAATAIENAHLYERLREHAETLEERVAERTAQLRAQYARLEAILDSTVNGIVVTGPDGELVLANPVARDWLTKSLSPEEANLLRETVQRLGERADENPERVLELTGLDLQLKAARINEPGVKEATAVVAIHDISHLKALDRMKSRFVSNVSHELRTPIATIKLFAHLMRKQPERWQEYLEPLALEANHQADLVEDILEISRVDAGRLNVKPVRTDLEELTEAVVANHQTRARKEGLTLTHRPTEPDLMSLVDTNRMMQVLDNLINNAIRYTSPGGTITVSTGRTEAKGRDWATITVVDTGMGIPEGELPHVFDRFFRGEKPQTMQISGTGLGLAIVKEIVELHGGRVTVESEVDGGSTFTVWLPLIE